jgi:hypothetical protein
MKHVPYLLEKPLVASQYMQEWGACCLHWNRLAPAAAMSVSTIFNWPACVNDNQAQSK